MFNVVYDTNVVVSGLLSSTGAPALLLDLVFNRRISLFLSADIFDEYQQVLGRPKFKISKRRREPVLRELRSLADWVEPHQRVTACKDPDDNRFLECAVSAKAEFLVTGNLRHFPKTFREIQVVSPRQFLEIYLESTVMEQA